MNPLLLAVLLLLTAVPEPDTPKRPVSTVPATPDPGVAMNNHYLDRILRDLTSQVEGGDGQWAFVWYDVEMVLISDESADRMRVISAVDDAASLNAEQLRFLMEVNFERALDAKYAIWRDRLWATYVHPLSSLSPDELKAGMLQVVALRRSYGTDFTSTGLTFGGESGRD